MQLGIRAYTLWQGGIILCMHMYRFWKCKLIKIKKRGACMQWMKQINSDYFIYLDELTYCMKIEMEARILHIFHKNYDCMQRRNRENNYYGINVVISLLLLNCLVWVSEGSERDQHLFLQREACDDLLQWKIILIWSGLVFFTICNWAASCFKFEALHESLSKVVCCSRNTHAHAH